METISIIESQTEFDSILEMAKKHRDQVCQVMGRPCNQMNNLVESIGELCLFPMDEICLCIQTEKLNAIIGDLEAHQIQLQRVFPTRKFIELSKAIDSATTLFSKLS